MRNSQKGFTLIEMLMAMAITAIIATVITVALSQTVSISWAGHKRMEAIKQVENALYTINRDAQVASSVSTNTPGYWLVFTLGDGSTISYSIIDPENTPVFLQRSQGGSTSSVALHIDNGSGLTTCSYDGNLLDVQVTSTLAGLGAASETRRIMVYPRLNLSGQSP